MNEKLDEIKEAARGEHIPVMLDETAMFLADFCSNNKPKNILEIGTAVGYSASIMLLNSGEDTTLTTIEINEKLFLKAKENLNYFGLEERAQLYLGDAAEILPWIEGEFDMIFLDGPKGQYLNYLPELKKRLIKGGVIVSDNMFLGGLVNSPNPIPHKKRTMVVNMRKYTDAILNDKDFETTINQIGDGIAVSKLK